MQNQLLLARNLLRFCSRKNFHIYLATKKLTLSQENKQEEFILTIINQTIRQFIKTPNLALSFESKDMKNKCI